MRWWLGGVHEEISYSMVRSSKHVVVSQQRRAALFFINNSVTQHHFFLSHPAYQGDDLLKLCRSFPDETHTCCVIAFSVSSQINAWFSRKDRNES